MLKLLAIVALGAVWLSSPAQAAPTLDEQIKQAMAECENAQAPKERRKKACDRARKLTQSGIAELDAEENKFGEEIDKAGLEGDDIVSRLLKQQQPKSASAKP